MSSTLFAFLPARRRTRHLLFWLAVAGYFWLPQLVFPDYRHTVGHYFFGFNYRQSPGFLGILYAYALGVGMLYAYAFRYWALPPLLAGRPGAALGRFVLLTVGVCYLFRLLCGLHVAWLDPWLRGQPARPFDPRFLAGWFTYRVYLNEYTTVILLIAIYKLLEDWQRKRRRVRELARHKLRTELHLLKTQVQPRLMLGSLAALAGQLDAGAATAPELVLTLSHFLRYVLYDGQAAQVPLAHDLDAMRQYLALEQARAGAGRLDVSFQVGGSDEAGRRAVAPLLLLPLLENACRHALAAPESPAWVGVQVQVSARQLKVSVANGTDPDQPAAAPGPRLQALRQRLAGRYAGRYALELLPEPGLFVAVLTLTFDEPTAPAAAPVAEPIFAYEAPLPLG